MTHQAHLDDLHQRAALTSLMGAAHLIGHVADELEEQMPEELWLALVERLNALADDVAAAIDPLLQASGLTVDEICEPLWESEADDGG